MVSEINRNASKQGNVESIIESELEETYINKFKESMNQARGEKVKCIKQRLDFG